MSPCRVGARSRAARRQLAADVGAPCRAQPAIAAFFCQNIYFDAPSIVGMPRYRPRALGRWCQRCVGARLWREGVGHGLLDEVSPRGRRPSPHCAQPHMRAAAIRRLRVLDAAAPEARCQSAAARTYAAARACARALPGGRRFYIGSARCARLPLFTRRGPTIRRHSIFYLMFLLARMPCRR